MPTIEQLESQRDELNKKITKQKKMELESRQKKLYKVIDRLGVVDQFIELGTVEDMDFPKFSEVLKRHF